MVGTVSMFNGQYAHTLDDKGRIVLPAKFRDFLKSGGVITNGYEGCLTIYTVEGWNKYLENLLSKPMSYSAVRKNMRVVSGSASDFEPDKAGRIKIPDYLLSAAGISKDVTIVGMGSIIEVWATDRWQKEIEKDMNDFEVNAEEVARLG